MGENIVEAAATATIHDCTNHKFLYLSKSKTCEDYKHIKMKKKKKKRKMKW